MNTDERPSVRKLWKLVGQFSAVNKIEVAIQLVLQLNQVGTLFVPRQVVGNA
jgi:hypothetical protein